MKADWTNIAVALACAIVPGAIVTYGTVKAVEVRIDSVASEIHRQLDAHERDIRELRAALQRERP